MRLLLLLLCLGPLSVWAEAPASVVVLQLEAEAQLEQAARSTTALLASHLAEDSGLRVLTPTDLEALQALGAARGAQREKDCTGEPCAQAGGLRYVVTGRLDRHGVRYVLTASLLDSVDARALARPRVEAASAAELPDAAGELAGQLVQGLRAAPDSPLPFAGEVVAGLRVNNSFVSQLRTLNPGGEVELGYRFHPEWQGFVQVGLAFVRRSGGAEQAGRLNVVPGVLGVRHFHRIEHALQPYWGLGLGLGLSFGRYGVFRETGTLPTVVGFGGLEYRAGRHLGLQLESGINVAQALLGFSEDGLGDGLNLDLNAGVAWHF